MSRSDSALRPFLTTRLAKRGAAIRRSVLDLPAALRTLAHRAYHRLASLVIDYPGRIRLSEQLFVDYGRHRSGWTYAVHSLRPLHNPAGVIFDSFIERSFAWEGGGARAYRKPWIGVIHVPPEVPEYFPGAQNNEAIFAQPAWRESLPHCRGLFTLSQYHRDRLRARLDVPVESLLHPSAAPAQRWSWRRFKHNGARRIVQIGWFLRNMHAIHQLPASSYGKLAVGLTGKPYIREIFAREASYLERRGQHIRLDDRVEIAPFLSDDDYDALLSENLAFVYLWDASASNTVVECMVRHCPILINPVGGVVEYLGEDYPLYYRHFDEAVDKAEDLRLVEAAHGYLRGHPKLPKLSGDYFRSSLEHSEIYRKL